ncbi:MAG: HD family phosphohydrolase, partial [Desulfarculaceae bacterium]
MTQAKEHMQEEHFFRVPPLMIFPQARGDFEFFLKQEGGFVRYTRPQEKFTKDHRQELFDNKVEDVFVLSQKRQAYQAYLEENLGRILLDERVPVEVRARVFYEVSVDIVKEAFEQRLPGSGDSGSYHR